MCVDTFPGCFRSNRNTFACTQKPTRKQKNTSYFAFSKTYICFCKGHPVKEILYGFVVLLRFSCQDPHKRKPALNVTVSLWFASCARITLSPSTPTTPLPSPSPVPYLRVTNIILSALRETLCELVLLSGCSLRSTTSDRESLIPFM